MTDRTPSGSPIEVLHVRIVTGAGGGPEKTILRSPRSFEGTRYRETACWLHAPGDPGIALLEARAKELGCPFLALEDPHPYDLRTLARLSAICRERGIRIWHGHDYKSNLFGVLLGRLCDLKLATTVHGWVQHSAKTPLYFAVDHFALRRFGEVVAVSRDLYDECLRIGVPPGRLSLIENAIDTEEFRRRARPEASAPRSLASSSLPAGRLLVGAVGRLSEEKGFHLLIEAVERAVDAGCDLELRIAGEGAERERLRRRIESSPHAARMRLLGFQPDVRSLFEAMDVFALSSIREGLPNVVLEAMAMEVAVLATRCGGLEAFGRDGDDMLLVEPGSAAALAAGLERLARDAGLRRRLVQAARSRVEQEHGFARRMERMRAVYDRLLDGAP
jgi:glycosyltransferase involved in cell wall biosynthesis